MTCLKCKKKIPIPLSRRLEESEKKRQAMMQAMKDQASKKGPNFTITRKDLAVRIFFGENLLEFSKETWYRATEYRSRSVLLECY